MGQIVPTTKTPTTSSDSEKLEKLEKTWGGPRNGSVRKGKTSESDDPFIEAPVAPDDSCEEVFAADPIAEVHKDMVKGKGYWYSAKVALSQQSVTVFPFSGWTFWCGCGI